eukprot:GHVQ01010586.1.p2 GENE.GHVQ01010586.1~~GHVQ01010586.1.p2  ORF type:complete len:136 (-),score=27.84 GHVQ01010586.1:97-504(-)
MFGLWRGREGCRGGCVSGCVTTRPPSRGRGAKRKRVRDRAASRSYAASSDAETLDKPPSHQTDPFTSLSVACPIPPRSCEASQHPNGRECGAETRTASGGRDRRERGSEEGGGSNRNGARLQRTLRKGQKRTKTR